MRLDQGSRIINESMVQSYLSRLYNCLGPLNTFRDISNSKPAWKCMKENLKSQ